MQDLENKAPEHTTSGIMAAKAAQAPGADALCWRARGAQEQVIGIAHACRPCIVSKLSRSMPWQDDFAWWGNHIWRRVECKEQQGRAGQVKLAMRQAGQARAIAMS
jgi:hypothetical protein